MEAECDYEDQGDVCEALDTFYPAPADCFVDEPGVDWGGDGAENGNIGEAGHRYSAVIGCINVTEGSADENCSNGAEQAQEGAADYDCCDVLAKR